MFQLPMTGYINYTILPDIKFIWMEARNRHKRLFHSEVIITS